MATDAQVRSFIARIAPIAVFQAAKHEGKIFTSVCIAQACCESAYGTAQKMVNANAVFGIKVGSSAYYFGTAWKGKAYKTGTTEYYDGKNPTRITDWFRAYDSIEESVEDYFDLLCTSKRYQHALNQATPKDCIVGIQKGPYATAPDYVQTIMSIINKYNLMIYDLDAKRAGTNLYEEPVATIRQGMKGNGVRWVQYALNKAGGYKLAVDGIFGALTLGAVQDFQRTHGLDPDGIVGPKTRAKLSEI